MMEGRATGVMAIPSMSLSTTSDTTDLLGDTKLPKDNALMAVILALEKEKIRLLDQIQRDTAAAEQLQGQVRALEDKLLAQRTKLSNYNALFMRMEDAEVKAPKQRLGAREAVLGTKRIIHKELTKLDNDVIVAEMKLNKSKEKNQVIKEKINTLRTEHTTYKKMFTSMQAELADLKANLQHLDNAIKDIYYQRDKAHEEMRELAKQFAVDKRDKQEDFRALCDMLEAQQAELNAMNSTASVPSTSKLAKGQLVRSGSISGKNSVASKGPRDEEALRRQLQRYQERIARDKYETEVAKRKQAAFDACLQQIMAETGCSDVKDLVQIFNRHEDEKFRKAQQAQRLLDEIEKLEHSVSEMHDEVVHREEENSRLKSSRTATLDALEAAASHKEAEAERTNSDAQKAISEVKSLYTVIEATFCSLGLKNEGGEMRQEETPVPESPVAPTASGSPLRRSRGSVSALDNNRPPVQAGISGSTLSSFMGAIDGASADLIQQYAAFLTKFTEKAERGDDDFPVALIDSLHEAEQDGEGLLDEEGGHSLSTRRTLKELAVGTGELTKQLLTSGTLGPANPTGKIREAVATSSLMAALTVDTNKLALTTASAFDDESRPLRTDELKQQAQEHFDNDKNIQALKQAANAAAVVLMHTKGVEKPV